MRFAAEQKAIAPAAAAAARLIPAKPVFQGHENILVGYSDGVVRLEASNAEASLELVVPVHYLDEEEEGEVFVPGRMLSALLSKMDGVLLFEARDGQLNVRLKDDRRVKARLPLFSPEGMVKLGRAEGGWLEFESEDLKKLLRTVLFPACVGVLFDLKEDVLSMVSYDSGHFRVSLADIFYPGCGCGDFFLSREQAEMVLPLLGGSGKVEVIWSKGLVTFRSESFTLTVRRPVVKKLPYQKVFDLFQGSLRFKTKGSDLLGASERAALFLNRGVPAPLVLECNGSTLRVSIEVAQVGSLSEELPCEGEGSVRATYNPLYLCDALRSAGADEVSLEFGENNTLKIAAGDYVAVVLPTAEKASSAAPNAA